MLTRLSLLIVIWLTACTSMSIPTPGNEHPESELPVAAAPVQAGNPIQEPTVEEDTDLVSREVVEKAKADLSKRFDVNIGRIHIMEARAVTWPDASLGCPQPDMVYAEVLTPGYWILLEADGKQYPYHTDQVDQLILCLGEAPGEGTTDRPLPVIPVNPDEIDDGEPWIPVD